MALEMRLKLNAPGMTGLHKAGLAGLYMTLRAFEEKKITIDGLTWELDSQQVTLHWTGKTPKAALDKLIRQSFWIDKEGFIRLTGLESEQEMSLEKRYVLYNALLNSFLQFGPHRPTDTKRVLTYEVDDKLCWLKEFAPIKKIRQHEAVKDFISDEGIFKDSIEVASWLYPGGGQRHHSHANTKLNETVALALLLMFAPVGVVYYAIRSRAKGRKARLAMLIPEIKALSPYIEIRRAIAEQGVIELTASSASDAALRMLITIEANSTSNQFAAIFGESFVCRVITFGIVSWNEKQKTRTYTRSVFSGQLPNLENYRLAASIFKNRWQQGEKAKLKDATGQQVERDSYFVTTYSAREFIADNIAQGKIWYQGIATHINQKETREQLLYERKELNEMVEKAVFDGENERTFIRVCHESWRRRLGKLGQRARNENLGNDGFNRLVKKETEKLRTGLARCKNAETLRETVVDFWARGGSNEDLQGNGLITLLPLFDEKNWRRTRDLALLALISYQPQNKQEAVAIQAENQEEDKDL